jgi:hypothetical protein
MSIWRVVLSGIRLGRQQAASDLALAIERTCAAELTPEPRWRRQQRTPATPRSAWDYRESRDGPFPRGLARRRRRDFCLLLWHGLSVASGPIDVRRSPKRCCGRSPSPNADRRYVAVSSVSST